MLSSKMKAVEVAGSYDLDGIFQTSILQTIHELVEFYLKNNFFEAKKTIYQNPLTISDK